MVIAAVAYSAATPAFAQFSNTAAGQALQLAIDQNLQMKGVSAHCGFFNTEDSTVAVLPINDEVLMAAAAYRTETLKLNQGESSALIQRARARYLQGDEAVFIVVVANPNPMQPDAQVFLPLDELVLKDEYRSYKLLRSTPIFGTDSTLGPGPNYGYLYFPNFRSSKSASYVLDIQDFYANLCAPGAYRKPKIVTFEFSFDDSELNFFDLLRRGVSQDALRTQYSIPTYGSSDVGSMSWTDLASLVIEMVSKLL